MRIVPYHSQCLESIINLSIRAWSPVFDSIRDAMDADIYQSFYPQEWQVNQRQAIEAVCTAEDTTVWVATESECTVGFIATKHHSEDNMGEIYMVAVDPDTQGQGIGSALIDFALAKMKEAVLSIAMVETGGDWGHAPAHHTYEKAGFRKWPVARYFKKL